ncbi:helix-turn-helix domain-containing protein [Pseudoalteromonas sp. Of7M-16]|uniref:helix-turn-helix domain-containing protein n=1 Tax=Pseudoalteromonas sp. Of7M-16 TaxID=2917756 RepID=UPI001EF532EF|nr:helix-turn-helix domain-containing protein [Pseudoalteromonas sp. Of7M-16]MCG7551594.1 helix-turn-helix domain-containing protein [Pseudoalteromonas sp. Of7M-16]
MGKYAHVTDDTRKTARKIKQMREELGYSITEFSAKLGVSYNTIKNWEDTEQTNEPGGTQLMKIQDLYKEKGHTLLTSGSSLSFFIELFKKLPFSSKRKLISFLEESIGDK